MNEGRVASNLPATQDLLRGVLLIGGLCALGLLLAVLPMPIVAGLVLGGIAVLCVLAQPLVGLFLLALAVPFGSPFNIQVSGFNFGPTEVLFALTVAAWLCRRVIARETSHPGPPPFAKCANKGGNETPFPRSMYPERGKGWGWGYVPPIIWSLAAFLFAISLTLTVTHSLSVSLKDLIKWFEVLLVVLLTYTLLKPRHIPLLLILMFVSAGIESAIGLYQTINRIGPEPFFVPLGGQLVMRSYGTFEQPNPFAGYLNFSLPLSMSLLLGFVFERGASRGMPGNKGVLSLSPFISLISSKLLFFVSLLTLPLIAAAFFFSLSRGAWLGFAFALVLMTVVRSQRAFMLFVVLALVAIGLLVLGSLNILPPAVADRIVDIPTFFGLNLFDPRAVVLTNENFGIVDRMAHWFAAWNMFNDFPWLGVGIGNYGVVYPDYGLREWPYSLGHAHNIYLNMLAETGLVGLMFYLLFVVSALLFAWHVARRNHGLWRMIALGILGTLVTLTVHNFFDNLYVHGMNIQLALFIGVLARMKDN